MRGMARWLMMASLLGLLGTAEAGAKKAPSLDDLFAAASKPGKKTKAVKATSRPKGQARSPKLVKGRAHAPAPVPVAPAATEGGAATPEQQGMVLAEYAPDRHALAGP